MKSLMTVRRNGPQEQGPAGNLIKRTLQRGPALTLKNSQITTYSGVTKERSYCIWQRMGGERSPGPPRQMSRH